MNLFWKKLYGALQSTSAFEKKIEAVLTVTGNHLSDDDSDEMQNNKQLEEYIHSTEFKQKKELYLNRKYKDTDEHRIMRRYEKLLSDSNIRLYYQTKNSEQLKEYNNFKSNPESLNLKNLSIIDVSDRIEKLKLFEQSKEYKNYVQYHDSLAVREFEELKKKISEPEFQDSNAFWANPDRWETTREYRMEQHHRELSGKQTSTPRKRNKISFLRKHNRLGLAFHERFDWNRLEDSRWSAGFHSRDSRLVGNYSFVNELQANSGGRNVSTANGILTLHTVQLPARSLAWNTQKGFVEMDFAYTSDVIQTSATFKQKYGIFCAKIRCSGNIHHALWLSGDRKLPHINIFYFNGEDITQGNADQHKINGVAIRGISRDKFYIYTLEWTPKALIWYINNVEVYRTTENVPHEPLHIGMNSFIPYKSEPRAGAMEVDWIRVYR